MRAARGLRYRRRSMHRVTPHDHQERWNARCKLAMNTATGFLMDFCYLRPTCQERKETDRFPGVDVHSNGLALHLKAGGKASPPGFSPPRCRPANASADSRNLNG